MNRILATLLLSVAAFGAAQAGELGYLDNPAEQTQSVASRAQVQQELAATRAAGPVFNGELDSRVGVTDIASVSRDEIVSQLIFAKGGTDTALAFING
jgi:hypothetical protein